AITQEVSAEVRALVRMKCRVVKFKRFSRVDVNADKRRTEYCRDLLFRQHPSLPPRGSSTFCEMGRIQKQRILFFGCRCGSGTSTSRPRVHGSLCRPP